MTLLELAKEAEKSLNRIPYEQFYIENRVWVDKDVNGKARHRHYFHVTVYKLNGGNDISFDAESYSSLLAHIDGAVMEILKPKPLLELPETETV